MFDRYEDAVQFMYNSLPMFHRIGAAALKHDLSNTIKLCHLLGNPEKKFRSVHVAGTNGKGSTSHMIASILQEAGYRTGLYTSPHLKDFTERIRLNGQPVPKTFVLDFVNRIHPHLELIRPSFFEITVAMAFDYFALNNADIVVVETGLGGRLDSTNVIMPMVSVITNIGWDHQDILGDSLEKIASEKAGIIKAGVPLIVNERQPGIDTLFTDRCKAMGSSIVFAEDRYAIEQTIRKGRAILDVRHNGQSHIKGLDMPLQGFYQRKNLAGVLATVDALRSEGLSIGQEHVVNGLMNVIDNTHLLGRWQVLGTRPLKVCDTGHNVDGIRHIVAQIRAQQYRKLFIVFGVVRDKELKPVLSELPLEAFYYFCQANIPRALDAEELQRLAGAAGLHGTVVKDVNAAIREAECEAKPDDFIFIGGSTFVVAEIENL